MEKVNLNIIIISYIMRLKDVIIMLLSIFSFIFSFIFEQYILATCAIIIFGIVLVCMKIELQDHSVDMLIRKWIYSKCKENFNKIFYINYDKASVTYNMQNMDENMINSKFFYNFVIYMNKNEKLKVLENNNKNLYIISTNKSELKSYLREYLLKIIRNIHEEQRIVSEELNRYAKLNVSLEEYYED